MWDKYFTCPSSSSEEENDVDVDMKDATPTPDRKSTFQCFLNKLSS